MLERLLTFSLEQRVLIVLAAIGLAGAGIWAWSQLKIEAYPDVADTEVTVIVKYPGRPAEEVEQQITIPIERVLNAVPRVLTRRSRTIFGLTVIKLTFEEGTDDYFARQQVLEKLRDVDLPEGAELDLGPLSTPVGEIYRYVLEGDGYSLVQLRELQDWVVIPALLQVPGIADVTNFGGVEKQYNVIVNPAALEKYGLTVEDVERAIQANNSSTGGNILPMGSTQLAIRSVGRIRSIEDLQYTVLKQQGGTPVFLRDVASVELGALMPSGVLGYLDKTRGKEVDDGVEGIVLMRRGENPSEVLRGVKEKIAYLNERVLPAGVRIVGVYDRTELVNSTLETVGRTLFEGVSIVVIVLVFFLGNLRAAFAVAVAIPLSLLGAFVAMKLTGIPANLLSLGAIDFGIIVDSAVVVAESIMRHLSAQRASSPSVPILRTIYTAVSEVQRQVFFAVVIIVAAYLPLFTLQRVEGKLFSPMAYTLSYAVGWSLVLALTLVPVLCSYLLARSFREWHNPVAAWIEQQYRNVLEHVLARPGLTVAIGACIVIGAIIAGTTIGTEFLPELDEGGFNIRCVLPSGVSLDAARQVPPRIRQIIGRYDEVKVCLTQLGRNDDGTDPYGPNRIESLVQLTPYSTWTSGRTKQQLLQEIKTALEREFPGANFSFSQPILDNVTEAVTGSAADLAVLINGDDIPLMRGIAIEVLKILRSVRGASESGIEQEGPQTQLVIQVRREEAARYGINIADINRLLELAIGGKPVSVLYEGERRFNIVVRYPRQMRSTIEDIAGMLVLTPNGQKIPLSQVADVLLVEGQTIIARQDGRRQVSVRTNIRGRDQGGYVAEAQEKVAQAISLPPGYTMAWGGQFENLTRARNRLMVVIPITLAIIFVILFWLFDRSIKYALLVMLNVPFALVGGVALLLIRGINFSVSAGVGFVSLFGVAIMSGVLVVSYINYLRQETSLTIRAAVRKGARTQLRPVLMMMTVALIGLIPAARATGIGSDVQRPLATVIVGGLATALVLTLTVLPALYYIVERRARRRTLLSLRQQRLADRANSSQAHS
ncbi:MAG: CusA/CzcA family heavy metal efflux RND transporter [Bacteroidota bacterium]|nr:CusA/CzcA family heavy metal efflux RND transporter [Candidatus Kapabacteria bacterium]MDW8075084.1 CusA/CzcA family heavy metal efflux RND transporter [Bacteroidota bacterium]